MKLLPPVALFVTMLSSTIGAGTEADAIARGAPSEAPHPEVSRPLTVHESYGRLPLSFERNQGQTGQDVKFLSRGRGYTLFLTDSEAVLALQSPDARPAIVRMSLAGASREVRIDGLDERPGTVNYFKGRDAGQWHRGIPTYARVRYAGVYPGVDLIYYSSAGKLQYDFIVAPGANPEVIRLLFDGARLAVDAGGDLLLRVEDGEVRMGKPLVYQNLDGRRVSVPGRWVLTAADQAGFELAPYDRANTLIIDPVLSYSTYLGGSFDDFPREIAVDAAGHAYVTGVTNSIDFPVTAGAVQPSVEPGGHHDAFVAKLEPDGSGLVYATYLGGSGPEEGWGIAVDGAGNAYVTGLTSSPDFPVTPGAFQTAFGSGLNRVFVAKLDPAGSMLAYSTFIGGSLRDEGTAIAVDNTGRAYVTGSTDSTDFPITPGAFQSVLQGPGPGGSDAFVTKLEADGSALVYSTFLGAGGNEVGRGIAVDAQGHAYVIGESVAGFPTTPAAFQPIPGGENDAFVTKLNLDGSALVYSTFLGGSGGEFGIAIAVDTEANAYVTGQTTSSDFPTTAGAFQTTSGGGSDAFAAKLNPAGSGLVYSTYLGGSSFDAALGIALDVGSNAYLAGSTESDDFPTVGAFQPTRRGEFDSFVAKLDASGSTLLYSTYLGGTGNDLAQGIGVDAADAAYVAGITLSSDFPTTPGVLQPTFADGVRDAFVSKITDDVAPPPPGTNSTGKVTGGGTVPVGSNFGTFSLAVERRQPSDAVRGNLHYINHATGARLRAVTFSSLSIAGSTVTFGGTCTRDGAPCTFVATVIDEGEPGTSDRFLIAVSSAPAEGGLLRSGNIRIH